MSNVQLMQNELEKAISSVDNVTTYELSNEELNDISGGVTRRVCVVRSNIGSRQVRRCVMRSRRFNGGDLE